jgi:hypothetical protein
MSFASKPEIPNKQQVLERVTDPEDKQNTPDQQHGEPPQESEDDNNEEPADTVEDEENESADNGVK